MPYDETNIFARILRSEIPSKKIFEDEHVLAFHDAFPKAPVHALVIPKGSYIDIDDFYRNASDAEILAFARAVPKVVAVLGLSDKGFRTIANTGVDGGQEVPHFHIHIVGGKVIGPMIQT